MNAYKGRAPGWDDWRAFSGDYGGNRYNLNAGYTTTVITERTLEAIAAAPPDRRSS